jgi:predicted pyridoxine 5'-phosphate oxidase superfamily flavin-nucleotide-binding protein
MWHAGERAVQERAGVTEIADQLLGTQEPVVPPVAREFLTEQPWIVLGAADEDGRPWASPLYGEPGFVTTPDAGTVHIAAHPLDGDPLTRIHGAVGGLALEPASKRRMRLNGRATTDATGITIELEQVYSNCPKYIAKRHPMPRAAQPVKHENSSLDGPAMRLLAKADTAFIATRAPEGADVSHRGGPPGFLKVRNGTVSWPDFQGNALFNTLGNLVVDPACGLTIIDPEDGTTLYLSGQATVADDRRVTLKPDRVVRLTNAAPISWWLEKLGRYPSSA